MDRKNLIELTNKIYRQTLLFPKKEPLRYKIREVADEILANIINLESLTSSNPGKYAGIANQKEKEIIFTIEKDLDVINSYFEIAKWQNWVNYFDILEIQEEYDRIKCNLIEEIKRIEVKEEIENIDKSTEKILITGLNQIENKSQITTKKIKLEPRKEKILKILERIERIQVGEINKLFPEVSKRTIRRDFQKLVKQGIIERLGERNNTFYRLKPQNAQNKVEV